MSPAALRSHLFSAGALLLTIAPLRAQQPAATAEQQQPERTWQAILGELAPDFSLTDLEGGRFRLSDARGKVVVLEWWSPTCPIVKGAHNVGGSLLTIGNTMHARRDVVWVALHSGAPIKKGDHVDRSVRGRDSMAIEYPVLLDPTGWVGRMYGAEKTPQLFVVDPKGKLTYAGGHDDGRGQSLIGPALQAVLAGEAPPHAETRSYGCRVGYVKGARLGYSIPPLAARGLDGVERRLADCRGAPLVLEWFNPTCPYAVKAHEQGVLKGAARRWAAKGVTWLAVNSAHARHPSADPGRNRAALADFGLEHPLLMDPGGRLGRLFGAATTPHVFILDERGVLVYAGGHDDRQGTDLVGRALTQLLEGKPVEPAKTPSYGCSVKYAD